MKTVKMLHKMGYWGHTPEFRELEWAYPNSVEHDGFLGGLCLRYGMDEHKKSQIQTRGRRNTN